MSLHRREWRGWADLPAMQALLSGSLRDRHPSAYIHPGDLAWWLGWAPKSDAWLAANVALWDDDDGELRAWVMLDGVDVGEWVDTASGPDVEMEGWRALDDWLASRPGLRRYVRGDDRGGVARLEASGYRPAHDDMIAFSIELAPFVTAAPDPRVRPVADPAEVPARAIVTRAAFGKSDRSYDTYLSEYRGFMASPAYPAGWDLLAWAQPGRAASCTIAWPDAASGVGNFEPVATHPSFERQGFGSAVMREGCRRFAEAGLERALVRTGVDNAPAIGLYRSVGFVDDHVQLTYERS
jgi:GNAT superfamily N-acetyltransferase